MKYQRFAPSGCKDIGIRRFEFVAKTQFLCAQTQDLQIFKKLNMSQMNPKEVFHNTAYQSSSTTLHSRSDEREKKSYKKNELKS